MCGIFAYVGREPLPITEALKVLDLLENEQEYDERTPVGGHGAGIAYLNQEGRLALTRVGKTSNNSPVYDLQIRLGRAANNLSRLILAHVRRASPEFQDTIQCKECTQPFQPNCLSNDDFTVITAHNGYAQDYQHLRSRLTMPHQFESLRAHSLIDSEVITHVLEEHLFKLKDPVEATHRLSQQVKGNNTTVTLCINNNEAYLAAIHNGKTRGLNIWTSQESEVVICSREHPVEQVLSGFLRESCYERNIKITSRDTADLIARFNHALQQ